MTCQDNTADIAFRKRRIDPLTSWRYFAAAMVVFYHCGKVAFQESPEWFRTLIQNGYQAVSFFFVLSGFILVYTYHDSEESTALKAGSAKFWIARVARVYPTYFLALLIAFPAYIYYAFVKKTNPLPVFTLGLVSVPLLLQAWLPSALGQWNGPAWSLSVEAFFYASFPAITRWFREKSSSWWLSVSLGLVLPFQLARHYAFPLPESGGGSYEPILVHHFFAYFPLFHLPSFVFGMALGKFYLTLSSNAHLRFQNSILFLSLVILIGLFVQHGKINPLFLSDTVMVPLFGSIIFTSATANGIFTRMLSHPWLVELGEASYGMYILHIPLVWWANRLRSVIAALDGKHDLVFFLIFFVFLSIISVIVFEFYEKPMRRHVTTFMIRTFIKNQQGVVIKATCHLKEN